MKNSDWDIDFRDGQLGENTVAKLLNIETVEVKTDRKWRDTGNLFIEGSCFYQASNSWEPSGLSVTQASNWAFVLEDMVLLVPTKHLKNVVNEFGKPVENNQLPNQSRGWLITPWLLLNYRSLMNERFDIAFEAHKNKIEQEL